MGRAAPRAFGNLKMADLHLVLILGEWRKGYLGKGFEDKVCHDGEVQRQEEFEASDCTTCSIMKQRVDRK